MGSEKVRQKEKDREKEREREWKKERDREREMFKWQILCFHKMQIVFKENNTIDKNIIGAPKMQNNYGAIQLLTLTIFSFVDWFFSVLLPIIVIALPSIKNTNSCRYFTLLKSVSKSLNFLLSPLTASTSCDSWKIVSFMERAR